MTARKLVPLKDAVDIVNKAYGVTEITGRSALKIETLYNAIWKKRIHKYGSRNMRLVDIDEVLKEYGPQT